MSKYRRHGSLQRKLTRALACAIACIAVVPAVASAAPRPPIETILQDDAALIHGTAETVRADMERLKSLGVDRVRLTAGWSVLAPNADSATRPENFDASDPNAYPDPFGFWANLDRAVRLANETGLQAMIDIAFWAPLWATSGDPGGGRATWNINPAEYAEFTKAVVRRYNGDYTPQPREGEGEAGGADGGSDDGDQQEQPPSQDQDFFNQVFGGFFGQPGGSRSTPREEQQPRETQPPAQPLPKVSMWTIWNEPNHPGFIQPQWERTPSGFQPKSPHIYRKLVEVAYPAIKGIQADSVVLVGGTSSTGARTPRNEKSGMQPLRFIRELACVDERLRPKTTGDCANYTPLLGDGFSHHPYSLMHKPDFVDPRNPDNLPIGALSRLTDTLDQLVRMGRIDPKVRNVYLTEFGYESNPPDPIKPWNPEQQARFLNWSEYLAWSNPNVRAWPQFLLRDMGTVSAEDAQRGKREFGDWQSGLFFHDGTEKPAATSFKLALFAECVPAPQSRASRRSRRSSRGRRARRSQAQQVRIWGHIRPGAGYQQVAVSARNANAPWAAAATAANRRGGARASSVQAFQTNAVGVFVRYATYKPGMEYRLERPVAGAAANESGLSVTPAGCKRSGRRS
jgi:hypothetical protein